MTNATEVETIDDKSNILEWRGLLIALLFTVGFVVWEIILNSVPFSRYLHQTYTIYNLKYFLFLQSAVFASLFLLFLYIYAILRSPLIFKIILLAFFFVVVFFEYGYVTAFSRYTLPIDLEIAFFRTNSEQWTASILSYFNFTAFFPCIALAALAFSYRKALIGWKKFLVVVPLFCTIFFYIFLSSVFRVHFFRTDFPLVSFENFFKSVSYIDSAWLKPDNVKREELDTSSIKPIAKPKNNIIFITDESLRADHLSLYGYERKTTPYLEKLNEQGKMMKFDSCVSATTCSFPTAELLLSGVKISDLPTKNETKTRPSIYQYASAMGYKVHFWDGQMTTFWNNSYKDRQYVDDWRHIYRFIKVSDDHSQTDFEIAKELAKVINSSEGNFIWIWKRGFHFPYHYDYPKGEATWKPNPKAHHLGGISREELVNSYDNAIKYGVDEFFKILMPAIENNPNTTVIYTGDHGQNLKEEDYLVTHCRSSKNEANVPLFMLGDFKTELPSSFKATHGNIFATILDLMEVPESIRKYDYEDSLLDPNAKSPEHRFYWDLDISRGTKIQFD